MENNKKLNPTLKLGDHIMVVDRVGSWVPKGLRPKLYIKYLVMGKMFTNKDVWVLVGEEFDSNVFMMVDCESYMKV
jgi:hypothetical protein